jgi:ATP/maltotriose-dependent transcriptional regulator MalT
MPLVSTQYNAQIEKQLFLISAPAGYGKTSLLVDWAHDADFPVAWYALDEFDNTPHTFLAYLIESMRAHFPDFGAQALAALEQSTDTLAALQSIVAMIANEIAHLSDHLMIVLDDYHEIQNEVIDQLIALLVRYAGENGHLFIGSRTLPRIPNQSLLLARGQMGGMGINELQFTAPEIQALAQQNYGLIVSERRAQELAQITKGWITALLLMGHQSGWRQLVESATTTSETTEHVFDYLAEQIFSKQPEDVRHFLLGSSTLDPLSPGTLDRLPELSQSRTYLKMLLEQHLFVTQLGGSAELYSYHPLFREFLRARLKREYPAWYERLYLACARIHTEQEQWDRVIEIYLDLGHTEDAVGAMEAAEESLRKLSDIAAMTHRFEGLPRSTTQFGPHLLSLKGKIHMTRGEQEQAVTVFDQAVNLFQSVGDYASAADKAVWKGTALRFLGRYRECIAESERVETFLARLPDHPAQARLRAAGLHMRGISGYYLGDLANAYADLKRVVSL